MSWIRVAYTWLQGVCLFFSGQPPSPLPVAYQERRRRKKISDVAGSRSPGTYFSSPSMLPEETSTVSLLNGIYCQCSRNEFHEHCQVHYSRGHISEGCPYVLWPLAYFLWWEYVTGRMCLWPMHGATCKYGGVFTYVRWSKGFFSQVQETVLEFIVMRRD